MEMNIELKDGKTVMIVSVVYNLPTEGEHFDIFCPPVKMSLMLLL